MILTCDARHSPDSADWRGEPRSQRQRGPSLRGVSGANAGFEIAADCGIIAGKDGPGLPAPFQKPGAAPDEARKRTQNHDNQKTKETA